MVDPVMVVLVAVGVWAIYAHWTALRTEERLRDALTTAAAARAEADVFRGELNHLRTDHADLLARYDALRREGFDPPEPREEWEPDDSPDLPPEVLGALVRYGGRRDSETFDRLLAETRGRLLEDDASPEDVVKWLAEGTPPEEFDV